MRGQRRLAGRNAALQAQDLMPVAGPALKASLKQGVGMFANKDSGEELDQLVPPVLLISMEQKD